MPSATRTDTLVLLKLVEMCTDPLIAKPWHQEDVRYQHIAGHNSIPFVWAWCCLLVCFMGINIGTIQIFPSKSFLYFSIFSSLGELEGRGQSKLEWNQFLKTRMEVVSMECFLYRSNQVAGNVFLDVKDPRWAPSLRGWKYGMFRPLMQTSSWSTLLISSSILFPCPIPNFVNIESCLYLTDLKEITCNV